MSRLVVAGLLGIGVLFAGSVGVIAWSTSGARATASLQTASSAPLAPGSRGAPMASMAPATSLPATAVAGPYPQPSAPVSAAFPAPDARPAHKPSASPPNLATRSLYSLRRDLVSGFTGLQYRVARCGPPDAVFTLDLETVSGGVRIVDAKPEARKPVRGDVGCVQALLRGEVISAPKAVPGQRWQMRFSPKPSV